MANLLASVGNVVTSGVSILQNTAQFQAALEQEEKQHEAEMRLMREQFTKEMELTRKTYLVSMYNDIETYFQELNENLINSTRDAERDMIDQRNQQFQTLLLAATLTLTALVSLIYEASMPENASRVISRCYAGTVSVALVLLLVTVGNSIIVTSRVTQFMLFRSKQNMGHLNQALTTTKSVKENIRGGMILETIKAQMIMGQQAGDSSPASTDSCQNAAKPTIAEAKPRIYPKKIAKLADEDVEMAWNKHENIVQSLLEQRARIFDSKQRMFGEDHNFEDFWRSECRLLADTALLFFYLGAACMLLAMMIFMASSFDLVNGSIASSYIAISLLGCTLIICLSLGFYLRKLDPFILQLNYQIDREADATLARSRSILRRMFTGHVKWRKSSGSDKSL